MATVGVKRLKDSDDTNWTTLPRTICAYSQNAHVATE